jgi:hypothetical protein
MFLTIINAIINVAIEVSPAVSLKMPVMCSAPPIREQRSVHGSNKRPVLVTLKNEAPR